MTTDANIQQVYQEALDSLIAKVKRDQTILAAVLFGSLSYDQVWEKSDIDIWLIRADGGGQDRGFSLTENGINIHAEIMPRNEFKRLLGSSLETSFFGSAFSRSTLIFSRDESIQEWYQNIDLHHVGNRDRTIQLLTSGASLLGSLCMAEREYEANQDYEHAFVGLMSAVQNIAKIEVVLHGEVPGREVIQPALAYRPELFQEIYSDPIHQPKNAKYVGPVLDRIRQYVDDQTLEFFQPVLDYLADAGGVRSMTEINTFFHKQTEGTRLDGVCDWLARKGFLQRLSAGVKLTLKSQVEMDEAAYYCEPEASPSDGNELSGEERKAAYRGALEAFVDRLQEDRYIVAAFLLGDMARDELWSRSFIDLLLIYREGVKAEKQYGLVQDGIPIRVRLWKREEYRKRIEGNLQGSYFHTSFLESQLLFSRDDTLEQWYEHAAHMGTRDQETQVMNAAGGLTPILIKAEKWCHVKNDLNYSFLYLLFTVEQLARLEVLKNGEIPGRKPIYRALDLNPSLFGSIYTDLMHKPKDERKIGQALEQINTYLEKHASAFFKPILDFLTEAQGIRTAAELGERFNKRVQDGWVGGACEWLVSKGIIEQVSSPRKLSKESRVEVEEVAYYYDDSFPLWD